MEGDRRLVALLHGPDQVGLVARTAGWIFEQGGNILHADQHRDAQAEVFFQRIEWDTQARDPAEVAAGFREFVSGLGMQVRVDPGSHRDRIALFVSAIPHCFLDFLLRWRLGEFHGEVVCVISNHEEMRGVAEQHGLPFHYVPVTKETKDEAEARQVELVRQYRADLVVLARYMQVLSDSWLRAAGTQVINIHHSFLPAFAGARPYHHAHLRGVKLIGATAHYATAVLDDGPIIQQQVARVSHRHSVQDLMRIGRDLEKSVLAQAVRWHLERRVLVYHNRTVIFD